MKFLKQKTLSRFSPSDQTLFTNHYGRAVMNLTGGLRLPVGTTDQRPNLFDVRAPGGANGYIRYNTTRNVLEAYVGGDWEIVAAPASTGIFKQTLGPGDYTTTIFGPLDRDPVADDNLLVFVENIFQISQTNFNILYNYQGSGDAYIEFTSPPPLDKFITIYFGFNN